MKILTTIALWLMVICFPVLLISSTLGILVNNIGTYNYIIDKYNIQLVTSIDEVQLKNIYQRWIDYYNGKVDTPQYEFKDSKGNYHPLLNEREIVHLSDVRGLMNLDYTVIAISLFLFFASGAVLIFLDKSRWQFLAKAVFRGSALTVVLFVAITALSVCCFDQIFILFHEISFSNDFWILNPASDYLIMMFPGGFFSDIVIIAFNSIIVAAVICGTSSLIALRRKHLSI